MSSPLYILATADLNKYFVLNIESGMMAELSLPADANTITTTAEERHEFIGKQRYHLTNIIQSTYEVEYTTSSSSLWKYWERVTQERGSDTVTAANSLNPTTSAFLVTHSTLTKQYYSSVTDNYIGTVPIAAATVGEAAVVYVISHQHTQPQQGPAAQYLYQLRANFTATIHSQDADFIDTFQLTLQNSFPLSLPCRVQGVGLRGHILYVIAENKCTRLFDISMDRVIKDLSSEQMAHTPIPRYLDYTNTVVFLIHKPVGPLSSAADVGSAGEGSRGTVYGTAVKAGFPANLGLVGRLDGDTSGIMVFTNDGLLNDRILRPPASDEGNCTDTAKLFVEGKEVVEVVDVVEAGVGAEEVVPPHHTSSNGSSSMPQPSSTWVNTTTTLMIDTYYKTKTYTLTLLQGRSPYCMNADGSFNILKFEEEFGQPLVFNRYNNQYNVKEADIKLIKRYQDNAFNPHNRPNLGWVLLVEVVIQEGKHKQIRRLAKRAGYHVIALQRTSICGDLLNLHTISLPGQCRWLGVSEKYALYRAFQLAEHAY